MAKRPKPTSVNVALLQSIAASSTGFAYATQDEGLTSFQAGLITVDTNNMDPSGSGKAAVSLTDAGKQYLTNMSNPEKANKPMFEIITAKVVVPPSKRGRIGAGAPTQYPFEQMEIGQTFFVPVSAKHPDPVKQLGSTVSSMNMKYSEETGETVQAERTKRGPGNKAELDAQGNKVKETYTKKLRKQTRKFVIRKVEKGQVLGEYTVPDNGALIARES